jgi:hypothetical protein
MKDMQSTPEEFLFVLKKWKNDSAKVRVAAKSESPTGFASAAMLEGTLSIDEAESTLAVVSEDGSMFTVAYSGAGVGFSTSEEQVKKGFPGVLADPSEIEEILLINDISGSIVCLFSLKP